MNHNTLSTGARHRRGRRERGATLVEISITLALILIVAVPAMQSFLTTMNAQNAITLNEEFQERLRRAGEEITHHLGQAGLGQLSGVPDHPQTSIVVRYRPLVSFDASTGPQWGSERVLASVGRSVILTADGRVRSLASGLHRAAFSLEGRILHVHLEVVGPGNADTRTVLRRTFDVALQN